MDAESLLTLVRQNVDLVVYVLLVLVVYVVLMGMQSRARKAVNADLPESTVDEATEKAAHARLKSITASLPPQKHKEAAVEDDKEELKAEASESLKSMRSEQQAVLTQYTSGDGQGAAEMEKMLAKDPNNLQLLDWLAFMYYSNNETEKAIETYARIIKLDATNPGQHYYLANSYYKANRIDEALVHWKKVVELKPEGKYAKKALDRIKKVEAALSS